MAKAVGLRSIKKEKLKW